MKKLDPDFQPDKRTYDNLRKHGAIPEFVDYELENFKTYFLDPELPPSKSKKSSWQMACQVWMRRAWKGKAGRDWEYDRHKRSDFGSYTFDKQPELDEKPQPKRKYKIQKSPAELEMLRLAGQL